MLPGKNFAASVLAVVLVMNPAQAIELCYLHLALSPDNREIDDVEIKHRLSKDTGVVEGMKVATREATEFAIEETVEFVADRFMINPLRGASAPPGMAKGISLVL